MVAVPALTPVTSPPFTVATAAALGDQVTVPGTSLLGRAARRDWTKRGRRGRWGPGGRGGGGRMPGRGGAAVGPGRAGEGPPKTPAAPAPPAPTPLTIPAVTVAMLVAEDDQVAARVASWNEPSLICAS